MANISCVVIDHFYFQASSLLSISESLAFESSSVDNNMSSNSLAKFPVLLEEALRALLLRPPREVAEEPPRVARDELGPGLGSLLLLDFLLLDALEGGGDFGVPFGVLDFLGGGVGGFFLLLAALLVALLLFSFSLIFWAFLMASRLI